MDELTPSQWIAWCAARLGERRRTVPVIEREATTAEVWRNEELRELRPDDGATRWLSPVGDH